MLALSLLPLLPKPEVSANTSSGEYPSNLSFNFDRVSEIPVTFKPSFTSEDDLGLTDASLRVHVIYEKPGRKADDFSEEAVREALFYDKLYFDPDTSESNRRVRRARVVDYLTRTKVECEEDLNEFLDGNNDSAIGEMPGPDDRLYIVFVYKNCPYLTPGRFIPTKFCYRYGDESKKIRWEDRRSILIENTEKYGIKHKLTFSTSPNKPIVAKPLEGKPHLIWYLDMPEKVEHEGVPIGFNPYSKRNVKLHSQAGSVQNPLNSWVQMRNDGSPISINTSTSPVPLVSYHNRDDFLDNHLSRMSPATFGYIQEVDEFPNTAYGSVLGAATVGLGLLLIGSSPRARERYLAPAARFVKNLDEVIRGEIGLRI